MTTGPWGADPRARPMRASDQDRAEAALALGDHFAEGRLDREEFDTRLEAAQRATYLHDLDPLFVDLPHAATRAPAVASSGAAAGSRGPSVRGRRFAGLPAFVPLAVAAVVTVALLTAGHMVWLLFPLWWIAFGALHRRRWRARAWAARGSLPPGSPWHAAWDHPSSESPRRPGPPYR